MEQHIKENEIITCKIKRLGINGEGIAYDQKLAIFVDGALPDETVEATITQVFDNRAVAVTTNVIEASPYRIKPFCPIYETCGGCQMQHITYAEALNHKRDLIVQSFDRYIKGSVSLSKIKPTIGQDDPMHYRNKVSLPIQKIKGKNVLGMYQRNSNVFIPMDHCPIQDEDINLVLRTLIDRLNHYQIDGYDPKFRKGYIRNVVCRIAKHTKEIQLSLIMLKKSNRLEQLAKDIMQAHPTVVSVYEVMNTNMKTPGFFTDDMTLIAGKKTIEETLADFKFSLLPEAFFQLNTEQADVFYKKMKEMANLKKHEIAIDAYAGIAPVSHYIASSCKQVYAIEIDPKACESAMLSLKKNKINNVTVLRSDFKRALSGLKEKKIDVMFFDPPRTGLGEETIDLILTFKPTRLIYGSCNPSTLAKDLHTLLKTYDLIETQPIDMFPHTALVESVSLLVLKK